MRRWSVAVASLLVISACKLNDFRSRPLSDPNAFAAALDVRPESLTTASSGLRYRDLAPGTGDAAKAGDSLEVRYSGWLTDGTRFDAGTYGFRLGAHRVIDGWDLGLEGMRVGGKRKLVIPPELGYGTRGAGPIPPNATLVFDVELLGIK